MSWVEILGEAHVEAIELSLLLVLKLGVSTNGLKDINGRTQGIGQVATLPKSRSVRRVRYA